MLKCASSSIIIETKEVVFTDMLRPNLKQISIKLMEPSSFSIGGSEVEIVDKIQCIDIDRHLSISIEIYLEMNIHICCSFIIGKCLSKIVRMLRLLVQF